jgi:hypothetical protein
MILLPEAATRSLIPALPVGRTNIEIKPCIIGQHAKPKTLRPPVAADEIVPSIDLVDISRGPGRKIPLASAGRIASPRELFEQACHPAGNTFKNGKRDGAAAGHSCTSGVCDGGADLSGISLTIAATKIRAAAIASVACMAETFEPGPVS